jgi:UDP-N-acetylglucosamine 2-epimerase (non-hydrolysing)
LVSLVAKRLQIPIYHLEAGNRAFDANIPEEINRRVIDHLADFNFPYSEAARTNLLREGLHPRRILKSGSPLPEVISHYRPGIESSQVVSQLELAAGEYFLISAHRAENVDSTARLSALLDNIESLCNTFGADVLVSTHPRTRDRMTALGRRVDSRVRFHEPFGFLDYMSLQINARCVISDSGTVSEEAAITGFPAVTLRGAMERPEALEAGVLVMTDVDGDLVSATEWAIKSHSQRDTPWDYQSQAFSHRVANAIFSTAPLHRTWSGLHS